jgi:2-phosphosulfolactate phosphatase
MRVEIKSLVKGANEAQGTCVVLDVFRSSVTMCEILNRGADRIIQIKEVEDALWQGRQIEDSLIFGERDGFPPEGFDHGNSPVEASSLDLEGRDIIMCTSAGSAAIDALENVEEVIIGCFGNAGAVIEYLKTTKPKFLTLLAVGKEGTERAAEDEMCAFYLRSLTDGEPMEFEQIKQGILESPTAQRLRDRGQEDDLEFCLRLDIYDFAPVVRWENGIPVVVRSEPVQDLLEGSIDDL